MRQNPTVAEQFQEEFYSKTIVNIREDSAAINMRQGHMVIEEFQPRFYSKNIVGPEEKPCSYNTR
jgi:hypothetical protein